MKPQLCGTLLLIAFYRKTLQYFAKSLRYAYCGGGLRGALINASNNTNNSVDH